MNANLYAHFYQAFASALNDPALVDADGAGLTFGELDQLSARFAPHAKRGGKIGRAHV